MFGCVRRACDGMRTENERNENLIMNFSYISLFILRIYDLHSIRGCKMMGAMRDVRELNTSNLPIRCLFVVAGLIIISRIIIPLVCSRQVLWNHNYSSYVRGI